MRKSEPLVLEEMRRALGMRYSATAAQIIRRCEHLKRVEELAVVAMGERLARALEEMQDNKRRNP